MIFTFISNQEDVEQFLPIFCASGMSLVSVNKKKLVF
jgi:hypothetical protein